MSALNFQNVMAQLIRFPGDSMEVIEARLNNPEMTDKERGQLRRMSEDPLVRKYGYKMQYCRQRDATQVMRLSKDFIESSVLDKMYQSYFEPSRTSSDLTLIGVQFLEFALGDQRCRELIQQGAPFLRDLMVYDHAKAFIVRQTIPDRDTRLPEKSLLRHRSFLIVNLNYDLPTIDRAKGKDPASKVAPCAKPMKLIFLRCVQAPFYRIFQIDETIERFLKTQTENPDGWQEAMPPAYPAMVGIGLVR